MTDWTLAKIAHDGSVNRVPGPPNGRKKSMVPEKRIGTLLDGVMR
jgi:hypothetical protein